MDLLDLAPETSTASDLLDSLYEGSLSPLSVTKDDHYDPLAYLDDLPPYDSHHQQPEQTVHEAEDDEDEYIDVSLPWTKESAHLLGDLGNEHANGSGGKSSDINEQLTSSQDNNSNSSNDEPTAADERALTALHLSNHHQRAQLSLSGQCESQWAVDLNALLATTNGTLEKFHLHKWRECFHLVRWISSTEPRHTTSP